MFLDRDGVLDRTTIGNDGVPLPPTDAGSLQLEPGAALACRRLKEAGLLLVVVTNQPDVARGTQLRSVVEEINAKLLRELPLDAIRVCYHDDTDRCDCRKPRPGMLTSAAEQFGIGLRRSVMVGDRWRDIEAGRRAGCATVLIRAPGAPSLDPGVPVVADHRAASLLEAVDWIMARAR